MILVNNNKSLVSIIYWPIAFDRYNVTQMMFPVVPLEIDNHIQEGTDGAME
jgi:hypothetical protein